MRLHDLRLLPCLLGMLVGLAAGGVAVAAEVVAVGPGSYLRGLPDGAAGPPAAIHAVGAARGRPMPTNDWWSSLAWLPRSEKMYPHPLAIVAEEGGLRVAYPGAHITANEAAIFAGMAGGGDDLVIGHSAVERFDTADVADWSDWFVTVQMGAGERGMKLSFGHGSPYVYAEYAGGGPVVTFVNPPVVFAGAAEDAAIGVRVGDRAYGLFAPAGSTWQGVGTNRLQADTAGRGYCSVAALPDDRRETFDLFARHAHAHVVGTKVNWCYDEARGDVSTTFDYETRVHEGAEAGTLFALYPHQWRRCRADFTGHGYGSVRGPMKLASGQRFETTVTMPPVLPSVPVVAALDRDLLGRCLAADLAGQPQLVGDTYWLGKQLGKWATMLPLAEQIDDAAAVAECDRRLRAAIENVLVATDADGKPKGPGAGLFAYEPAWGTLIGYPASFGSDDQLNDHHFHYGYFLRAAGELARRDPAWAERFSGMLRLLVRDIASPDRDDPMFPFLRCFDPYAGHSWASGHAKFGDGNNNESSSEAANAWFGMLLLGEATGDRPLRDMGAWLYATEIAAIEEYWFDVREELHPPEFPATVVTMVWGGKGANATWFSANPEMVHGINFLPVTGGSLYLGRWPDYARTNYEAILRENLAVATAEAKAKNLPPPNPDGVGFDAWADLIWMYRAVSDPADARRLWEARPADFQPEAGNSLSQTAAWIAAFEALGLVDRETTADTPFAVVFEKAGVRTYVAWNLGATPRRVTFSDGVEVPCPPRAVACRKP